MTNSPEQRTGDGIPVLPIRRAYALTGEIDRATIEQSFARVVERLGTPEGEIEQACRFVSERDGASTKDSRIEVSLRSCGEDRAFLLEVTLVPNKISYSAGTLAAAVLSDYVQHAEIDRVRPLFKAVSTTAENVFWEKCFPDGIPVLNLPADNPRPPIVSFEQQALAGHLDSRGSNSLGSVCERYGVNPRAFVLAAYAVVLSRYAGQEDLVVGWRSVPGEPGQDLPVRCLAQGDKSFLRFVEDVANTCHLVKHNALPLDSILDDIGCQQDLSRAHGFDTAFQSALVGGSCSEGVPAGYDLELVFSPDDTVYEIRYAVSLFHQTTAERFRSHFERVLASAMEDPQVALADLSMLSEVEQKMLLNRFNDTSLSWGTTEPVHTIIERLATTHPARVAVRSGRESLTYREMRIRSSYAAKRLSLYGVEPGDRVGLLLQNSIEAVVAILGILKAGCAYVPVDVSDPAERVRFVLGDAGVKAVVTTIDQAALVGNGAEAICVDGEDPEDPCELGPVPVSLDDPAYVVYTSGSTGMPKGVVLRHRGLQNLAFSLARAYPIEPGSRVLQFASLAFDASVSEIFGALAAGATLCLADKGPPLCLDDFLAGLERDRVSVATLPPSLLRLLSSDGLPALKTVVSVGEACTSEIADKWGRNRRLINAYGPSEATVCATLGTIDPETRVTIGRPIPNTRAHILGPRSMLTPIGVFGELCLSGSGIADGYLNQETLTEAQFVRNPFVQGDRLYRTGDLARWLPDGRIEYGGRQDDQVQLSGFRVELTGIEHVLLGDPAVRDAVMVVRGDGQQLLCGFVVLESDSESIDSLRRRLETRLPAYMRPSRLVALEAMPRTRNGKIDRDRLEVPPVESADPPRNDLERKILDAWRDVLPADPGGVTISFFDVGGTSVRLLQLHSRLQDVLDRELPIVAMFDRPTVRSFANWLKETAEIQIVRGDGVSVRQSGLARLQGAGENRRSVGGQSD